jgi:ABC-type transporter Mla subunit MlaD
MSAVDSEISKLAANVVSLQKDMAQVGTLVDRLDTTIEKLTEVSTTVAQLLAVQGNRLEFQEKVQEKLQDLVEKRRQETDTSIKDVYIRIEKVEADLYVEIEASQNKVLSEIKEMRAESAKQHEELKSKVNRVEKWMWTLMGAATVLGVLIRHVDFSHIFG